MANEQNLIAGGYKLSLEEASKGGKASVETRRKNASLRKAMQAILSGTYMDKSGKEITGADALCMSMFKIASNSKDKQAVQAFRSIMELTGEAKIPAEADRDDMAKLDAILQEVRRNAFDSEAE